MNEAEQDKYIEKLQDRTGDLEDRIRKVDDRIRDIEGTIKNAKIWIVFILGVAGLLGFGTVRLYDEYKKADSAAAKLGIKIGAYQVELDDLDKWWTERQKLSKSTTPAEASERGSEGKGLVDLVKRINDFSLGRGAGYSSDVQALRNFALEYFLYIEKHPGADKNAVVRTIQRAVDDVITRSDFSKDDYKQWHQIDAPRDFKDFLDKFEKDRGILNQENMDCYKSEISFWYTTLTTGPGPIKNACRDLGIIPYE